MKITDTRHEIVTPEGAFLFFDVAGVGPRVMAYSLDLLIRGAISFAVFLVLLPFGGFGTGISLIVSFLLEWFYPVLFEVWFHGATPGKKTMKICVINDDGTPVGFSQSLLRNLLRVVDFLPVFYIAGIISIVCNKNFKRLGDLAAGTQVIYCDEVGVPMSLEVEGFMPIPPHLNLIQRQAILSFAERHAELSVSRQAELAAIFMPLLPNNTLLEDAPVMILKMANTLLGRQTQNMQPNKIMNESIEHF